MYKKHVDMYIMPNFITNGTISRIILAITYCIQKEHRALASFWWSGELFSISLAQSLTALSV